MEISEKQLAEALTEFHVLVRRMGTTVGGQVAEPHVAAGALFAQLSANAAHDAEIARCRQFGPRCDTEGGPCTCPAPELEPAWPHAAAHVCCEHAPEDRELRLMAHFAREIDQMGDLAVARVMAWLYARYPPD